MFDVSKIVMSAEILPLISEIDGFKAVWKNVQQLTPELLQQLKKVATIESIGSSTRIEGCVLSDRDVEKLLSNLEMYHLEHKIVYTQSLLLQMPAVSAQIITLLQQHGRLSISQLQALSFVNRNTLKKICT